MAVLVRKLIKSAKKSQLQLQRQRQHRHPHPYRHHQTNLNPNATLEPYPPVNVSKTMTPYITRCQKVEIAKTCLSACQQQGICPTTTFSKKIAPKCRVCSVCIVNSWCDAHYFNDYGTPPPTPDVFVLGQHTSGEPFCDCGTDHHPIPKSGNCIDLETAYDGTGISCYKMQTLCRDTCYCNDNYVDPTKCVPQTCNNVSEPFCKCGIDGDHYSVPESGNCMEVLRLFSTTPTYNDRFGFGCLKMRTVCKCVTWDGIYCECNDECISGCNS